MLGIGEEKLVDHGLAGARNNNNDLIHISSFTSKVTVAAHKTQDVTFADSNIGVSTSRVKSSFCVLNVSDPSVYHQTMITPTKLRVSNSGTVASASIDYSVFFFYI